MVVSIHRPVYQPDRWALEELIAENYITRRKHRVEPLYILNYTPKTAFGKAWNEHTLACRGLILDEQWNVIARPFPKFFNLGEFGTEWLAEPFDIYEKLDGSLGIGYWSHDGPALATRGSFQSEQATEGTRILREQYGEVAQDMDPLCTYLFEIIFPANRIVVDYGKTRDIVLLAVIDTMDGTELPLDERYGFKVVKKYDGLDQHSIQLAQLEEGTNREGYVIRFASGVRAKVKLEEYSRIHRLVTQVTPRRIWEHLSTGGDIMPLVVQCPPAYQEWVRQQTDKLLNQYSGIEERCKQDAAYIRGVVGLLPIDDAREIRKQRALLVSNHPYKAVMYRMLDGKTYADVIWKLTYPDAAQPFKVEV